MLLVAALGIIVLALVLFIAAFSPAITDKLKLWHIEEEKKVENELDRMFYDKNPTKIMRLYYILPPTLGILGLLLLHNIIFCVIGVIIGLFIPNMLLKVREKKRRFKFNSQLLDAIMILSSSLKGGLSMLQALEVLQEEMPSPMNEEIGLVVRENKMGVTLEESFIRLKKRMYKMEDLELIVNSILVARETGGDITKVLARLSTSIRDNRKLRENMQSLTLQGKMQGMIMSVLPFLFVFWVLSFNREHFDIMLNSEIGRTLLFVAAILQVVGMILIRKFSSINV